MSNASQVFGQPDPARRINEKSPTVTKAASPSRRYNPWVALVEGRTRVAIGARGSPSRHGENIRSEHSQMPELGEFP